MIRGSSIRLHCCLFEAVVHNAKIFIPPLQNDLALEPEKDVSCIKLSFCGMQIIVCDTLSLSFHVLLRKNACFVKKRFVLMCI